MLEDTEQAHIRAAVAMVELFASVGVERFELTHTNLDQEPRGCRHGQSVDQIKTSLPHLVPSSFRRRNNVILRPHKSASVSFIQLDDLGAADVERVKPAAFMVIETSPANFQAWLAVDGAGKDDARRLRKGSDADATASGATRVAGTANHKHKYEPDFPIVTVTHAQAGKIVTMPELEALGLVAPAAPPRPRTEFRAPPARRAAHWPNYARCLANAPAAHGGEGRDVSRADFAFAVMAIDWGHSPEEVAGRLMEYSTKARSHGQPYADMTAKNAAAAVAEREQRPIFSRPAP